MFSSEAGPKFNTESRKDQEARDLFEKFALTIQNDLANSSTFWRDQELDPSQVASFYIAFGESYLSPGRNTLFLIQVKVELFDGSVEERQLMVKCGSNVILGALERDLTVLQREAEFLQDSAEVPLAGEYLLPLYVFSVDRSAEWEAATTIEVTPFCQGLNLQEQLESGHIDTWDKLQAAIHCLTRSTNYLHKRGRVHGDIKLNNVFFGKKFVLSDFLETMFDFREAQSDETAGEDARAASSCKTLSHADDRFIIDDQAPDMKDFGYDYFSVVTSIYQLFARGRLPYETISAGSSVMSRVINRFKNPYRPIQEELPPSESFAELPHIQAQLDLMHEFVARLDALFKAALVRNSDDDPQVWQDRNLVARFNMNLANLIIEAEKVGTDLDGLVAILNLSPRHRTLDTMLGILSSSSTSQDQPQAQDVRPQPDPPQATDGLITTTLDPSSLPKPGVSAEETTSPTRRNFGKFLKEKIKSFFGK